MLYKKVLLAYDGSDSTSFTLEHAAELARVLGEQLHALWISEPPPAEAMFVDDSDATQVKVQSEHQLAINDRFHRLEEKVRLAGTKVGTTSNLIDLFRMIAACEKGEEHFHSFPPWWTCARLLPVFYCEKGLTIAFSHQTASAIVEHDILREGDGYTEGRVTRGASCDVLTF